jgi:hypothetical protein
MRIHKPWIGEAIQRMENNNRFFLANPEWNYRVLHQTRENEDGDDQFWYQNGGFSDQCYLIKAENYRADIYNEPNIAGDIFPAYGGELFEKRVNSYLKNHNLIRLTSKHAAYRHRNYPKIKLKRWLWINLGIKIE